MKVIFGFENTLCLEKKLQPEPRAHHVSPLHLLCLGIACSPGEPPHHAAAALGFVILTDFLLLRRARPHTSVSFDLTPLSIVKTALSKQPWQWGWE